MVGLNATGPLRAMYEGRAPASGRARTALSCDSSVCRIFTILLYMSVNALQVHSITSKRRGDHQICQFGCATLVTSERSGLEDDRQVSSTATRARGHGA